MKVYGIVLLVMLVACSRTPASVSLCAVAQTPERYIGIPLTISGMAKMGRHGSTLSDPSCPDRQLGFVGPPTKDWSDPFHEALAGTLAPGQEPIRVMVTGRVAPTSGLPSYVFQVTTGARQ
jgi:hypothetical protein